MSEKKYPSDKQDKFMLRLPEGMRGKIKSAAEESGRSMNTEIVLRLEHSLLGLGESGNAKDSGFDQGELKEKLQNLEGEMQAMRKIMEGLADIERGE